MLGVLYESYIHPITILSTLPSAGVGAVLALMVLWATLEFSIIALIGVILLIGIVKKNAIMMIDFALDAERNERLELARGDLPGVPLRFRPIMMTTMAAMLGALPLAIGFGEGAELRRPLGISIVGGLLVSQMLTLYTTPVIYLYLDRLPAVGAAPLAGAGRAARPSRRTRRMTRFSSSRRMPGPIVLQVATLAALRWQHCQFGKSMAAAKWLPAFAGMTLLLGARRLHRRAGLSAPRRGGSGRLQGSVETGPQGGGLADRPAGRCDRPRRLVVDLP